MSVEATQEKWDRAYSAPSEDEPRPANVLVENAHLLPPVGDALDLACGLGGNALFLALRGFRVNAWDISSVAIARLVTMARRLRLKIEANVRDVESEPFPCGVFDVVTVSHFLARPLAGPICDSLRPGGLLFYQTFLLDKPDPQGPNNPNYLLAENELLQLFGGLRVLFYREEGLVGDLTAGNRNEAYFVGQRKNHSTPDGICYPVRNVSCSGGFVKTSTKGQKWD